MAHKNIKEKPSRDEKEHFFYVATIFKSSANWLNPTIFYFGVVSILKNGI